MKTKSIVVLFCTISLLLNACGGTPPVHPPAALPNPAVTTISMDFPGNGSIYSVGRAIALYGGVGLTSTLAPSPTSPTIRSRAFLANGVSVGTGTPVSVNAGNFTGTWTPRTAGEYYLQSKVTFNNGSTAISEPNRICVMPASYNPIYYAGGFTGLCSMPTRIPDHATSGVVAVHVVASPSVVWYNADCPSYPDASFTANVDDPQDQVAFVQIVLETSDAFFRGVPLYINWITTRTSPVYQKEYRRTIPLTYDLLHGSDAVRWTVMVIGRNGSQPVEFTQGLINIQPGVCAQQQHLLISTNTPTPTSMPTSTPTPVEPPTFTLKKNAFCRKGPDVSFPDVTAVLSGETVDILNVSEDGFWYFIYWKKFDAKCWVATGTGDVNGDVTGLKVLIGPALPEPKVPPKPGLPPSPVVPTKPLLPAPPKGP